MEIKADHHLPRETGRGSCQVATELRLLVPNDFRQVDGISIRVNEFRLPLEHLSDEVDGQLASLGFIYSKYLEWFRPKVGTDHTAKITTAFFVARLDN
ncbi:MAG: hypothetical protein CMF64_11420 [Magnetovibrio sp.]|nr:hypothetical protein [Magnetovibrio sp.]